MRIMDSLVIKKAYNHLSPFNIYLHFSEIDRPMQKHLIETLNQDSGLTQDVFKFIDIERTSAELVPRIKENNVIVRLIGNKSQEFPFKTGNISLSQEEDKIKIDLTAFLLEICKSDIANIKSRIDFYLGGGNKNDDRPQIFQQLVDELSIIESNLKLYGKSKRDSLKGIISDDSNALGNYIPGLTDMFLEHYREDINEVKSKYKKGVLQESDIKKIVELLNDLSSVADEPEHNPSLRVELIYNKGIKNSKGGWQNKPERIFKIIDGTILISTIDFKSKDATMLFALMLYQQKENMFLKRDDLLRANPMSKSIAWIKTVFEYLYPGDSYEDWYEKMVGNPSKYGQRIYDTKGKINRAITAALKQNPKYVPYLYMDCDDEAEVCNYKLNLSSENIILPKELQDNIEE